MYGIPFIIYHLSRRSVRRRGTRRTRGEPRGAHTDVALDRVRDAAAALCDQRVRQAEVAARKQGWVTCELDCGINAAELLRFAAENADKRLGTGGVTYAQAAAVPAQWSSVPGLDDAARAALMGGTAAKLFGFEAC